VQIEAVLILGGNPVTWHAGTLRSTSILALDALLLLQEAYDGSPLGMPGYPPSYHAALGDPSGFMACCFLISE